MPLISLRGFSRQKWEWLVIGSRRVPVWVGVTEGEMWPRVESHHEETHVMLMAHEEDLRCDGLSLALASGGLHPML